MTEKIMVIKLSASYIKHVLHIDNLTTQKTYPHIAALKNISCAEIQELLIA